MTKTSPKRRRCVATTKSGEPCGMAPLHGQDRCWNHSLSVQNVRQRAKQAGGKARMRKLTRDELDTVPVELRTTADALELLERAATSALGEDPDFKRIGALTRIASVAGRLLAEQGTDERIRELEDQLARLSRPRVA